MAKKISKSSKAKKTKTSKKAAAKKRSKKTVAKRPSAKKPATKRTNAPGTKSKRVSKNRTRKAKRKPLKNVWKISPQNHHAVYLAVFEKDGVTIELYQAFVHAFVIVDQRPNLTGSERDKGVSIDKFNYSHYESSDDSEGPNWTFPDNFSPEQQRENREPVARGIP